MAEHILEKEDIIDRYVASRTSGDPGDLPSGRSGEDQAEAEVRSFFRKYEATLLDEVANSLEKGTWSSEDQSGVASAVRELRLLANSLK